MGLFLTILYTFIFLETSCLIQGGHSSTIRKLNILEHLISVEKNNESLDIAKVRLVRSPDEEVEAKIQSTESESHEEDDAESGTTIGPDLEGCEDEKDDDIRQVFKPKDMTDAEFCKIIRILKGNKKKDVPYRPETKKVVRPENLYLPENYNKYEVPRTKLEVEYSNGTVEAVDQALECGAYLNIRGIRDFDELNEQLTLDVDLILLWIDGYILGNSKRNRSELANLFNREIFLTPEFLSKVWIPDIYFEEVISVSKPSFLGNTVTVVLYPSLGLVVYRARYLIKLSCPMYFKYYPADTQECSFNLKSFSYTTKYFELTWYARGAGTGVYLHETSDPNFDYQVKDFTSFNASLPLGPHSVPSVQYSQLQFTVKARRKMTYHLVQTYFASVFFVVVTWLCFLIPPDMFECRVGIAMSTLLTLTAMFSSVREQTPIVSYTKAIDIWMVSSVLFIFVALSGFTVTAWIKRGLRRIRTQGGLEQDDEWTLEAFDLEKKKILTEEQVQKKLKVYKLIMICVERFAVYILSAAYLTFNLLYWSWLISESDYWEWKTNSTLNKVE